MIWIDTSKDFEADRFLCGARCSNDRCQSRVTFDGHNYSRSRFAEKFNRRVVREYQQRSIFDEQEAECLNS